MFNSPLIQDELRAPSPSGSGRWFGDYRFGTFIADTYEGWRPRFFVNWAWTAPSPLQDSAKLHGAVWTL